MKDKIRKNRALIDKLILIFIASIICIPLLKSKLNVYQDDGIQHIARAYGTLLSIKENGIFPNVISSFGNNFGYSWNLFYGPISSYGIILIRILLGRSYIVSYKIFVWTCMILSGITMYKCVYKVIDNRNVALLSSAIYMTFPYHLTDLYIRNALAEYVSFIFIPLVFLGLYNLFYTTENNYYIAIGAIGLILTHNISTIIVAIFAGIQLIFNLDKLKETHVKKDLVVNIIFIFFVTCFYWLPFLEAMITGNYHVYQAGAMATAESAASRGIELNQLIVTKTESGFVFELGPHILIMFAFSVMTFRLLKEEFKEEYIFCALSAVISLWMSTKYFPWKFLPDNVCIIQFPWRMLMIAGFFLSFVCGVNVYTVVKKFNYKDALFISMVAIGYTIIFMPFFHFDEGITDITNLDLGRFSGKDREYVAGIAYGEYLPEKAYKDRFYIATREPQIYVLEGKALIYGEEKAGTKLKANIETYDEDITIFELPYIYYPGYEVRIDGMIQKTFQTENGFLGIGMGKNDTGELSVSYKGTDAMKKSILISFVSFVIFGIYVWKKH